MKQKKIKNLTFRKHWSDQSEISCESDKEELGYKMNAKQAWKQIG